MIPLLWAIDRATRPIARTLFGKSEPLRQAGLPGMPRPVRAWYWLSVSAVHCFFRIFSRWERVGLANLPRDGGWIFASNHISSADPPLTAATIFPRWPKYMAKIELFQKPVAGYLFALSGAFPVRRFENDLRALRTAQQFLEQGEILAMFPEGHRSDNASLIKAHPGTALIALRTGVPVVPVAITGSENLRRGWRTLFQRPTIRIMCGQPFRLQPEEGQITRETVEAASLRIMREIAALLPVAYRGVYRERFADLPDPTVAPIAQRPEEIHAAR